MYEKRKEIVANIEKEFPTIVERMQKMLRNDSTISDNVKQNATRSG